MMVDCVHIVQTLKAHLSMEDQLDSTPGINEAVHYVNQVRQTNNYSNIKAFHDGFLFQICQSTNPADNTMRLKMYPILASLTNDGAQQVSTVSLYCIMVFNKFCISIGSAVMCGRCDK